jgi:hypothetical protein
MIHRLRNWANHVALLLDPTLLVNTERVSSGSTGLASSDCAYLKRQRQAQGSEPNKIRTLQGMESNRIPRKSPRIKMLPLFRRNRLTKWPPRRKRMMIAPEKFTAQKLRLHKSGVDSPVRVEPEARHCKSRTIALAAFERKPTKSSGHHRNRDPGSLLKRGIRN